MISSSSKAESRGRSLTSLASKFPARCAPRLGGCDAGTEVASNEADIRRLVVIVMDDARTGFDHGESLSARKIAHAIVDELGPSDLAAVAFTFMGTVQNLTADRALDVRGSP